MVFFYNNFIEQHFLHQRIILKKHFSNREMLLYDHFYETTKIYPKNLIVIQNYVFFFIDGENYFRAQDFLFFIRKSMVNKIILIVREEETLIKLLFNLFTSL